MWSVDDLHLGVAEIVGPAQVEVWVLLLPMASLANSTAQRRARILDVRPRFAHREPHERARIVRRKLRVVEDRHGSADNTLLLRELLAKLNIGAAIRLCYEKVAALRGAHVLDRRHASAQRVAQHLMVATKSRPSLVQAVLASQCRRNAYLER